MLLAIVLMICGTVNGKVVELNALEAATEQDVSSEDMEESSVDDEEDFEDCEEDIELSSDENLEVTYNITSKWDGHYNMDVTLLNISGEMIDDWEVCFDFKDNIKNIWNAKVVDTEEGESVTIRNADWNQDIDVNKSVTFGMTVSYQGEIEYPQECYLTRERCEVDKGNYSVEYIQYNKWDEHVCGQIIITNIGNKRIEDWKLDIRTFETVKEIENIWNAKLLGIYDEKYLQIDNATYNQNIEPGKTVEFGFIAKCDGDFMIKESTLYHMDYVKYEDGTNVDEIIDPDSEDWEPEYDLDDFESYEEYIEYLKEIGCYSNSGISNRSKMRTQKKMFEIMPIVKNEMPITPKKNEEVKALQSYLWDGNDLLTQFRNSKSKYSSFLCHAEKKGSNYFINQGAALKMIGFSHGQSFERFTVQKDGEKKSPKYKKYMLCAGAGCEGDNTTKKIESTDKNGWAKNVVFLDENVIMKKGTHSYKRNFNKIKKIVGLNKVGDVKSKVMRVDAALSSNGEVLAVWCKLQNYNKRQVSLYDMGVIKRYLYNNGQTYYNLNNKRLRDAALITTVADSKDVLQPNESFQSIEVGNAFSVEKDSTDKNKWQVYITSGNESKKMNEAVGAQKLTVTRFTMTRGKSKLTNRRLVYIQIPHNKEGVQILSGTCEIEGCHIKGDELQFILTKSKKKGNASIDVGKGVQYIVGMKKTIFSDDRAKA